MPALWANSRVIFSEFRIWKPQYCEIIRKIKILGLLACHRAYRIIVENRNNTQWSSGGGERFQEFYEKIGSAIHSQVSVIEEGKIFRHLRVQRLQGVLKDPDV
jgi:hypothetical protein